MAVSKAQARATQKYDNKAYFKSLVRFKKEDEKRIRAAAGNSLNGFIVSAVLEKVQQIEQEEEADQLNKNECPF
jgi:uncharacterized protein (DUF1778 family)